MQAVELIKELVSFAAIMKPMFKAENVLDLKAMGHELSAQDIRSFIVGVTNGDVTDAQLGAFTMAVRFMGMNHEEQTILTLAMRNSGSVLQWANMNGPVLDKHSTGGVGDVVSLILAPMIAAAGGYIPMISGRGLGHTGGTLDKLESVPGFSVQMDLEHLKDLVRQNGLAMIGQGPDLAPADGRMYAVRDVTATVESIPLIVSSILSKKLAEGLDGLVLDVKTGNGAFMQELEKSRELAEGLCNTSRDSGTPCTALITDMNQPLCWSAGNAVEVLEAIRFVTGVQQHPALLEVTLGLAAELLVLGHIEENRNSAVNRLKELLANGMVAERFAKMIAAQGGPVDLLEKADQYLPEAPVVKAVESELDGWISGMDTRELGMTVLRLGGGRVSVEDTIDPRVGLSSLLSVGDRIVQGQAICMVHAKNMEDWSRAADRILHCVQVAPEACGPLVSVHETIS
jgi:thymidine phosphorylase